MAELRVPSILVLHSILSQLSLTTWHAKFPDVKAYLAMTCAEVEPTQGHLLH